MLQLGDVVKPQPLFYSLKLSGFIKPAKVKPLIFKHYEFTTSATKTRQDENGGTGGQWER
jgi:hypothetical protein